MSEDKKIETYQTRTIEWRDFESEHVEQTLKDLIKNGWEVDGPAQVKAGMYTDLYFQKLVRCLVPKEKG